MQDLINLWLQWDTMVETANALGPLVLEVQFSLPVVSVLQAVFNWQTIYLPPGGNMVAENVTTAEQMNAGQWIYGLQRLVQQQRHFRLFERRRVLGRRCI